MRDGAQRLVALVEVECARIASLRERHGERFLRKVFQEDERRHCLSRRHPDASLAARFAARVGLAALCRRLKVRTPVRSDTAGVVLDEAGGPEFHLSTELARDLSGWSLDLSLSHDGGWAAAAVMAQPVPKRARGPSC